MKINREPIKNWFGYTRRERRASFILIIIIFLVLGSRMALPEKNYVVEDISDSIVFFTDSNKASGNENNLKEVTRRKSGYSAGALLSPAIHSWEQKKYRVELNSCDTSGLIALPGIGKVLSVRIIKYRNLLGGFASVEQLKEVYGLPPETFELIKGMVWADTANLKKIDINSAGYSDLSRLRYFEKYEVSSILKYRELRGRIANMNDLTSNNILTVEKAVKVRPYLKFD